MSCAALDSALVLAPVSSSSAQLAVRLTRMPAAHTAYVATRNTSTTAWSAPLSSADAASSTPAVVATASSA